MHGAEVCARVEVFLQDILNRLVLTQDLRKEEEEEEEMMMKIKKKTVAT